MSTHRLDGLFYPKSVAIVGATDNPRAFGYDYPRHLIDYGFQGAIYPINPKRTELFDLKVYPDIYQVPGPVDYAIVCIGLPRVPDLLIDCSKKGVKFVHLVATGGSEIGDKDAIKLEKTILERAQSLGIRILGPNCLGIYSPEAGIANGYDFPTASGPISALIQSGGNSTNLIRWGSQRGLRFSKVASYGNALDLNETEFLNYFAEDDKTKVILCYIEGVKDRRAFLEALSNAARLKPVIILKGGRTQAGARAVSVHHGFSAGSARGWESGIRQAGAISVARLEDMIDLAIPFCLLPPVIGMRVGLQCGGGAEGVMASDECETMGFDVIPLPPEVKEKAKEVDPDFWQWLGNPQDPSASRGSPLEFGALSLMAEDPNFDFLISNLVESAPMSEKDFIAVWNGQLRVQLDIQKEGLKPLILVLGDRSLGINDLNNWRWKLEAEVRTKLINAGIPFYPSFLRAAKAMKEYIAYCRRKSAKA